MDAARETRAPEQMSKGRVEALSDGIFAISSPSREGVRCPVDSAMLSSRLGKEVSTMRHLTSWAAIFSQKRSVGPVSPV